MNSKISFTAQPNTLVDLLRGRAKYQPNQRAYTFLANGETEIGHLTYADLDERARQLAAKLQQLKAMGERVLLLFPPGQEFINAFFGCIYAGAIPVPMTYTPRLHRAYRRFQTLVNNAEPTIALTTAKLHAKISQQAAYHQTLTELHWLVTNDIDSDTTFRWHPPSIDADTLAFLQYTSGSTRNPRGVMLSHGNLLNNLAIISDRFGVTTDDCGVIWLPPYHDMGLIGGYLQPIYGGFPVILMDSFDFVQQPIRWLRAITHYRGTISGGPNFAFEHCLSIKAEELQGVDLSSWRVAFVGAEPVRYQTLERFSAQFSPYGFQRRALYPCYGLAESTLMVTGGDHTTIPSTQTIKRTELQHNQFVSTSSLDPDGQIVIGCGQPVDDHTVLIVDPDTQKPYTVDQQNSIGEIWISGPSVAQGYWREMVETQQTFQAQPISTSVQPSPQFNDHLFLRTGDLGALHQGELFITGRLKDMIIIRGENYYPQDFELAAENSHPALQSNGGAAFIVGDDESEIVIVHEIKRHYRQANLTEVIEAIQHAIAEDYAIRLNAVVLIKPGSLPRTPSGKTQRYLCREKYLAQTLPVLALSDQGQCSPASTNINTNHLFRHFERGTSKEALRNIQKRDKVTLHGDPSAPPQDDISQSNDQLNLDLASTYRIIENHSKHKLFNGREENLEGFVRNQIEQMLGLKPASLDVHLPIDALGLDSLKVAELKTNLEKNYQVNLTPELLSQNLTIVQLVQQLNFGGPLESWTANNTTNDTTTKSVGSILDKAHAFNRREEFQQQGIQIPYFRTLTQNEGPTAIFEGRQVLMFGSNNYLGLTTDKRVREATAQAALTEGPSLTGSRLLNGSTVRQREVEEKLAAFLEREDALIFTTGYQANIGLLSAFMTLDTTLLIDELCHASIYDGAAVGRCNIVQFQHNDVVDLEKRLQQVVSKSQTMVMVDGVYSMEGDIAYLPEIQTLCQQFEVPLAVDDAHALGTLGTTGRGTEEHFEMIGQADILSGTFSKSLASVGGWVAANKEIVEWIRFYGRSMLFSASIPPPALAAASMALDILGEEPWRVHCLNENAIYWRTQLNQLGFNTGHSTTAIVPIIVGDDLQCLKFSQALLEAGVYVNTALYPAVPKDSALLRTSVMATHERSHLDQALEIFATVSKQLGIIE